MASIATGYVVPSGVAASMDTLATDLALEADINATAVVPSATKVSVLRRMVEIVTDSLADAGTATTALTDAIASEGNSELAPGTVISTT